MSFRHAWSAPIAVEPLWIGANPRGRQWYILLPLFPAAPQKGGPYNVVLVDLKEGVRLMSHVTSFADEDVPIGLPVQVRARPGAISHHF